MSDLDPATTALDRELGIERMYPDEWFQRRVSDAHDALDAARPLIAAAERQRIRSHPLTIAVIDKEDGHVIRYHVPARLLDGDGDE